MSDPAISACVAVYNGAELLPRCLKSILAQTRASDEILVLDDGSTDGSADVASAFPWVRVIRQDNAGIGAARKRLVEEASADWIAFCDHDDWWEPDRLEKTVAAVRPNATLVYSGVYNVDEQGAKTEAPLWAEPSAPRLRHLLPHQDNIHTSATLLHRQSVLDSGNFPVGLNNGEDALVFFRLLARGEVVQVPERLVFYAVRSGSASAPGRATYEHEARLFEDYLLPQWDQLFAALPSSEREEGRQMVLEKLGYVHSMLGVWKQHEGDRAAAIAEHQLALSYSRSKGNLYRWLRCRLGLRASPRG